MHKTCLAILSFLTLLAAAGGAAAASQVEALKLLDKQFDHATRELSFELWNDSEQTITAWRLSLSRSDPHGHAESSILDQDFFDRVSAAVPGGAMGPLPPGTRSTGRWRLHIDPRETASEALSVVVVTVVFEDLSWQGNEEAASSILAARAARVRETGRIVELLEAQDHGPRSRELWVSELARHADRLRRESNIREREPGMRSEAAAQLSAARRELAEWLDQAGRELLLAPNPAASWQQMTGALRGRWEIGLRSLPIVTMPAENQLSGEPGGDR